MGPLDPWTIALTSAGLLVVVAVATWLPARRALRSECTRDVTSGIAELSVPYSEGVGLVDWIFDPQAAPGDSWVA